MTQITFFKSGLTVDRYADSAVNDYVNSQRVFIKDAANKLGMPLIATAIAGSMAEENNAYNFIKDPLMDRYALSSLSVDDIAGLAGQVESEGGDESSIGGNSHATKP